MRCAGFSLRWLLLLWSTGSRHAGLSSCGSQALEHRLRSCDARAQLPHGMWDLPGPGLEPVFPALAGKFLTTAPPGKSLSFFFETLPLASHTYPRFCPTSLVLFPHVLCRFILFYPVLKVIVPQEW